MVDAFHLLSFMMKMMPISTRTHVPRMTFHLSESLIPDFFITSRILNRIIRRKVDVLLYVLIHLSIYRNGHCGGSSIMYHSFNHSWIQNDLSHLSVMVHWICTTYIWFYHIFMNWRKNDQRTLESLRSLPPLLSFIPFSFSMIAGLSPANWFKAKLW